MQDKKFKEDPLISFIVPIYDIKPDVLKRCLLSLDDQDYENIEIVCVLDGPNDELSKVACGFVDKNSKKFKLIEIEHAGACAARNAGFRVSNGEIVSFFNSDYIAQPGMAKLWVDTLLNNPEYGFVYGSYQYNSSNNSWYPSKKFDPWVLEVANYIDCGFPLWRKYVVEWDPNCKSLQDWDFWIRVIKEHKVKGFYLPPKDISFLAEPPRQGGLSQDSATNWIDRVSYVKKKNGIPLRDIVVTSIGAPNHGVEIAKMIGADYRDDTIYKPWDYKAVYLIGFFMRPDAHSNDHPLILSYFKEKYPKTKRIVHFIGADIYWLRKFPWDALKYLSGALNLSCDYILCETHQAKKELENFGIKAEILPIPSYSEWEVKEYPKDFSVSVFLTEKSDFDKYCYEHTLSIIRAMPDIKFTAYGDAAKNLRYPNLELHGNMNREEWQKYVYKNSVLLRLVRHDTLPMAGYEFIMAGRRVITNIEMPYADYISTKGKSDLNEWDSFQEGLNSFNWPSTKKQIVTKIRDLKKQIHNVGEFIPSQKTISDVYKNILDKDFYISKIKEMANA